VGIGSMSDQWKQLRSKNIGGSEIPALFGESSYITKYKLWHTKKGNIDEENLDDIERIQAGQFMEEGAIKWANHKFGMALYQPKVYVTHKLVKGMGCTPDAYDAERGTLAQVKNVDSLQFALHWEHEGPEITRAPLEILLQCQHEMEVEDKEQNDLIVLVGGNRLFKMLCKRDREIGKLCCDVVDEFWRSIDENIPPDPEFDRDSTTVKELRKKLPVTEIVDMTHEKYICDLAARGLAAYVEKGKILDKVQAINTEILHLVGNAQNVRCGDITMKFYADQSTPRYSTTKGVF
jgi:predicted phage-related endonuclease